MTHKHCDLGSNWAQIEICLTPSPRKKTTLFSSLYEEPDHLVIGLTLPTCVFCLPLISHTGIYWCFILLFTKEWANCFKSEVAVVVPGHGSWLPNQVRLSEGLSEEGHHILN